MITKVKDTKVHKAVVVDTKKQFLKQLQDHKTRKIPTIIKR